MRQKTRSDPVYDKGRCQKEKDLAIQARNYTRNFLRKSKKLKIKSLSVGYYGRPIVEVRSERGYLNQQLLDKGLALPYKKNNKAVWCD